MPYYFKKRVVNLLFIHIPKTGGSSVEQYLSKHYKLNLNYRRLYKCLPIRYKMSPEYSISAQHFTYKMIMDFNHFKINLNNLSILTIVRNPYTRLVSDLFYNKLINVSFTKQQTYDVIKIILNNNLLYDNHFIPQYKFVENNDNEIVPGLIILRTETLTHSMKNIGYIDFDFDKNKNQDKNGNKINYFDYLNDDSIKLINEFYNKDFELFGYNKINLK